MCSSDLAKANLRYFAPPVMVLTTLIGLGLGISGQILGFLPLGIYLLIVLLAAVFNKKLSFLDRLALLPVLPAMHFSWGIGFIAGLFQKR